MHFESLVLQTSYTQGRTFKHSQLLILTKHLSDLVILSLLNMACLQLLLLLYYIIHLSAKQIINGVEYTSIRELFNDSVPDFSDDLGAPSVLDILFTNDSEDYMIRVNNVTWLYSGDTAFRSDGKWAQFEMVKYETHIGSDAFGENYEIVLHHQDISNPDAQMLSHFKYYQNRPDILIFAQGFPNGLNDTALTSDDMKQSKPKESKQSKQGETNNI